MNRRSVGTAFEKAAAERLKEEGYEILEYNFRSRFGEIDIIAEEEGCLVFVEVKYRRNENCGDPLEAVDYRKQERISRVADWYMGKNAIPPDTPCRFDVVGVLGDRLVLERNAFSYIPPRKLRRR